MYLFNRSRLAHSQHLVEAAGWSVQIAQKASAIMGTEIGVWASVLGTEFGRISWTGVYDSLDHWATVSAKLSEDADYLASVAAAAPLFTGPTSDGMLSLLSEFSADGPPFEYVAVVSATAAQGKLAASIQHGLELAARASALGGLQTVFGTDVTGDYGGVRWLTGAPSMAALESAMAAINGDPGFVALVDDGGDNFAQGAQQALFRRIA